VVVAVELPILLEQLEQVELAVEEMLGLLILQTQEVVVLQIQEEVVEQEEIMVQILVLEVLVVQEL